MSIRAFVFATFVLAPPVWAQDSTPVASAGWSTTSTEASNGLNRTVALNLDKATLPEALAAIAATGAVHLSYSREQLPKTGPISLVIDHITVLDALHAVLGGTDLDIVPLGGNWVALVPRGGARSVISPLLHQQGTATLSGYVRDSATGTSIPQVIIHVDGTSLSTKSGSDGAYKITDLASGEYRVTARRVGYLVKTVTVTLSDGVAKTLNFGLNPPATQLNEVVTTALGEQRRYQVGNVISTINVDSIAPNAPVTSVTDLISGRAPGVEIMETSGMVGSGESIRIQGQSSLLLQSDPIIIVDGVREDNTPGGAASYLNGNPAFSPSRINDIDFNQIETINILKGPAATTEYGTDAANGVIVITTKRGVSGHPQWGASATYDAMAVPEDFPEYYFNWGHATNGTGRSLDGTYGSLNYSIDCSLASLSSNNDIGLTGGSCVTDSVTEFNPLDHAATTMYGTGPSESYDISVGGGDDMVRYYFAGGMSNATGATHVPSVFLPEAMTLGYPESALNPNSQNQASLRTNMMVKVTATTDVSANVAYMSTYQEAPGGNGFGNTAFSGNGSYPIVDDSSGNYGYGGSNTDSPLYTLGTSTNQQTERWTGGATINWQPASWFTSHLTMGIDHGAQTYTNVSLPVAILIESPGDTAGGQIGMAQTRTDLYTVDLAANATTSLLHVFRVVTSFGFQYNGTRTQGVDVLAGDLSSAAFSLNGAGVRPDVEQLAQQQLTAGVYAEENFTFGGPQEDRCFVPLALRFDAGSGDGASINNGGTAYPKYGLSCLVLTGATTLRVRSAFGASGRQPPYGAAFQTYLLQPLGPGVGPTSSVYDFSGPGNLTLQPERSQEVEGGFDIGLWHGRLQGEFTASQKTTQHALWTLNNLGFDLDGSYTENVGEVRNTSFEESVTAILVQQRWLSWSVTINNNVTNNKLVRLASGLLTTSAGGYQQFVQGYPLFSYWFPAVSYAARRGDGILEADEISFADTSSYDGVALGPEETSFSTSAGFWRNTVTVNGLFDYRTGFKVLNAVDNLIDQGANVVTAPLWWQALTTAQQNAQVTAENVFGGTFLRFRELSFAYTCPRIWARAVRVNNLSIVGGVRNLALWTKYPFGDPEVSSGAYETNNRTSGTATVNNDIRSTSLDDVPLTRQWNLRVNLGW